MWSIVCNMITFDFEKDTMVGFDGTDEPDELDELDDANEVMGYGYGGQREMSLEERFRAIYNGWEEEAYQGELQDIKEQLCMLYDVLGEDKEL